MKIDENVKKNMKNAKRYACCLKRSPSEENPGEAPRKNREKRASQREKRQYSVILVAKHDFLIKNRRSIENHVLHEVKRNIAKNVVSRSDPGAEGVKPGG